MAPRPRRHPRFFVVLLLCLAGCGAGGGGQTPFSHPLLIEANAYGLQPLEGARLVSPEVFAGLLDRGEAHLISERSIREETDQVVIDDADARALAQQVFADDPDMAEVIDRAFPAGDPNFRLPPDGSVLFRGIQEDAKAGRAERWFALGNQGPALRELIEARAQFERPETQHAMYARMYPLLPTNYIVGNQLPHPDDILNESAQSLRNRNGEIAEDWRSFIDDLDPAAIPPGGYPDSWRDEEGVGFQSDRDTPDDVSPTGLWSQINFPLKWCATRVRDQGKRGTSRAFAVTGAVEARFAAIFSRWLNLSEQLLFNQAVGYWEPRDVEERLRIGVYLEEMTDRRFRYPYEATWDYNRSLFRERLPLRYIKSCWADATGTPYAGGPCSDTTHQSEIIITRIDSRVFYAVIDPGPLTPRTSRVRLARWSLLYLIGTHLHGPDGPVDPLDAARLMLAYKIPVTLLFWVPSSFATTPSTGVVPFDPTELRTRFNHAMLMVGYVPNADLPAGGPPAAAGGGYFICKNSWGTAFGDAGYCYVSADWIWRFAYSMHAIDGVTDA